LKNLSSVSNSKYKVWSLLRSSSAKFLEKVILKLFIFFLPISKRGDRREITAVLDNMGQIRENKQEVIDVVYNFYADLYKGHTS
jgi:hypothetical protein